MADQRRARLLIVEDSQELLTIWETLFNSTSDYEIVTAANGSIALDKIADGYRPDLLMTDYYLGDLTGLELVEKLHEVCDRLKVVMITGNDEDHYLKAMANDGKLDLLIKPVKFKDMQQIVATRVSEIMESHSGSSPGSDSLESGV